MLGVHLLSSEVKQQVDPRGPLAALLQRNEEMVLQGMRRRENPFCFSLSVQAAGTKISDVRY